jgi:ring-1,2-phenylacetyl-CoA epoxidase subunit PaaD
MVNQSLEQRAWTVLRAVPDPEIPLLSIVDLGIVRHVRATGERIEIGVSPTYSGCPATDVIRHDIAAAAAAAGLTDVRIVQVLAPAWSTDWISDAGRKSLADYGIVPPQRLARGDSSHDPIECPRCHSDDTEALSEFGSTPCKALHRCRECLEPFERFKCL